MKKSFIKSATILIIGGFITKLLGMLIKIIITRIISTEGLSLYILILPTFNLLINLSQCGMPIAFSKLISENKRSSKKLLFSNIPIILILNIILIITIISTSSFISNNLLHNPNTKICLIAISTVIPFTTISSICRSYFFGKQKMFPHIFSNIVENIIRLILIIIILPKILIYKIKYQVLFLILLNIISEIISTSILIFFLPKNIIINKKDLYPNKDYIKASFKISIPNTLSRLISSITYFIEPIILINLLSKYYSNNYIITEYGILNGYVIPLILLPSFFTIAISLALLPIISNSYANGNRQLVRRRLKEAVFLSLIIGFPVTIILFIKPTLFLQLLYHTTKGKTYLKVLTPIFILQYLQAPLITTLDAINKSNINLRANIISMFIRIIVIFILANFKIGIYPLIISIIINIFITTIYLILKVLKYIK